MIDEDACEVFSDGFIQNRRGHGGIDSAREGADDFFVADLLSYCFDLGFNERGRLPFSVASADPQNEVLDDLLPINGVFDLGVELRGIESFLWIFEDRVFAVLLLPVLMKPSGKRVTLSLWDMKTAL